MQPNTPAPTTPWLIVPTPKPKAELRLICLPYAGSGAAPYRPWAALLPPTIELCIVQLPGRETRWRETPYTTLTALIDALVPALQPALARPYARSYALSYALFGHSMGALVAFELARALRQLKHPPPAHLFISSRRAPQLPETEAPLTHLAEAAFVQEMVRRYNAIPQAILDDEDMLRLFLPTLRADMHLIESYTHAQEPPLDCPITAFGGSDDPRASRSDLAAWRLQTQDSFQLRQFAGDHFYLIPQRQSLVAQIAEILAYTT